jgi:hypothetical protein
MNIDIQTIVIIVLVAFIVGVFVGVAIARPRYPNFPRYE